MTEHLKRELIYILGHNPSSFSEDRQQIRVLVCRRQPHGRLFALQYLLLHVYRLGKDMIIYCARTGDEW